MAVIDDFKSRFPEFDSGAVDAYLPSLIDEYPCLYGGDYTQECDKIIILYLLAHMLVGEIALQSSSAPDLTVLSRSVGNVSESYGDSMLDKGDAFFATTKYGRRYLALISKNIGGFWV